MLNTSGISLELQKANIDIEKVNNQANFSTKSLHNFV